MGWQRCVTNRTQADVDEAIRIIAEWKESLNTGTSIFSYDLKGCLNASDLNRIEANIAYLSEELTNYYYPPDTSTRTWTRRGMPNIDDVKRIISDVEAIIEAFYKPSQAPSLPSTMLKYSDINAIEKNLELINELLVCMVGSFKSCGTYSAGQSFILPIRR